MNTVFLFFTLQSWLWLQSRNGQ